MSKRQGPGSRPCIRNIAGCAPVLLARGLPVAPTHLEFNVMSLRLSTMITTFGLPQHVTADALRVGQSFQADATSAKRLRQPAGA